MRPTVCGHRMIGRTHAFLFQLRIIYVRVKGFSFFPSRPNHLESSDAQRTYKKPRLGRTVCDFASAKIQANCNLS